MALVCVRCLVSLTRLGQATCRSFPAVRIQHSVCRLAASTSEGRLPNQCIQWMFLMWGDRGQGGPDGQAGLAVRPDAIFQRPKCGCSTLCPRTQYMATWWYSIVYCHCGGCRCEPCGFVSCVIYAECLFVRVIVHDPMSFRVGHLCMLEVCLFVSASCRQCGSPVP